MKLRILIRGPSGMVQDQPLLVPCFGAQVAQYRSPRHMKRDTGVVTRGATFLAVSSCVNIPQYQASILFDTPHGFAPPRTDVPRVSECRLDLNQAPIRLTDGGCLRGCEP